MTEAPNRIQLRRTKGWRKPTGAIVVSRPARWGNPFQLDMLGRDLAVLLYSDLIRGVFNPNRLNHLPDAVFYPIADAKTAFLRKLGGHPTELVRSELAGHDLACWCSLDQPCHADVLLEVANA